MSDIFKVIGKILGLIFAAGVIAFTGWMTMKLGQRLIPGDTIMQWMILVLFDVAAFVWFVQFVTQARGTLQWAIAGLGWLIGLAGAIIMTAGELVLGQKLVVIDDPTRFGWIIIATVVVSALAHAVLIYFFHFADPATRNRIENAQKTSQAIERAYANARQEIENNVDGLTQGLVASALHEAQQQINAVTAYHIRSAGQLEAKAGEIMRGGPVVDGTAKDATVKDAIANGKGKFGVWGWKKRASPDKPSLTQEQAEELTRLYDEMRAAQADTPVVKAAETVAPGRIEPDPTTR